MLVTHSVLREREREREILCAIVHSRSITCCFTVLSLLFVHCYCCFCTLWANEWMNEWSRLELYLAVNCSRSSSTTERFIRRRTVDKKASKMIRIAVMTTIWSPRAAKARAGNPQGSWRLDATRSADVSVTKHNPERSHHPPLLPTPANWHDEGRDGLQCMN